MIEIIGEFFARRLFAVHDLGAEGGVLAHVITQAAEQIGIFRHGFSHDVARALKRRLHIGHLALHISFRQFRRIGSAVFPDGFRKRAETAFTGDFRAGAAFRLIGQVEVFQLRLGPGLHDLDHQLVGHLALTGDGIDDGGAARIEFAQIDETFRKRAQLGIIKSSGHFLAVTGDEGNGRALVQQGHRRLHLIGAGVDFGGDERGEAGIICGHEVL
ncbi:hypothetical protein D3C80_568160 [compost metagenome]